MSVVPFGAEGLLTVPEAEDVIGIFADMHGALRRLHRMRKRCADITTWLCAGDVCDADAQPRVNELALLGIDVHGIPTVLGNHDRQVRRDQAGRLHPDALAVLDALPRHLDVQFGDLRIRVLHATPKSLTTFVDADDPPEAFHRHFSHQPADVVVLGHTHKPFDRTVGGHRFLNPGALGDLREPPTALRLHRGGQADLVHLGSVVG